MMQLKRWSDLDPQHSQKNQVWQTLSATAVWGDRDRGTQSSPAACLSERASFRLILMHVFCMIKTFYFPLSQFLLASLLSFIFLHTSCSSNPNFLAKYLNSFLGCWKMPSFLQNFPPPKAAPTLSHFSLTWFLSGLQIQSSRRLSL